MRKLFNYVGTQGKFAILVYGKIVVKGNIYFFPIIWKTYIIKGT